MFKSSPALVALLLVMYTPTLLKTIPGSISKTEKKMIEIMNLAYTDTDPQGTARRALVNLYQTDKKFETFWAEFSPFGSESRDDTRIDT